MTDPARDHDIVVYGATGFVGVLTAKYLAEHAPPDVRIALGGRSQAKLEQTRAELGVDWPLVIADSQDRDAVAALAESARVVATTVGPYFKYGKPLVEACAAAGTHYADLTGEVLFMRWAIDAADAAARASGARIVHTCGFDSIPSDIGTLLLHEAAQAGGHGELEETSFVVKAMRGAASGGTIDSAANGGRHGEEGPVEPARAGRSVRPQPGPRGGARPRLRARLHEAASRRPPRRLAGAVRDGQRQHPRRAPQQRAAGSRLRPPVPLPRARCSRAAGRSAWRRPPASRAGIAGMFAGLATPGARQLLDRVLPDPGEGPDESARERGFFNIDIHTTTSSGERLRCEIRAPGDPGYKATAVMLGESALCLALDDLPDVGGRAHARVGDGPRARRPPHRGGAQLPRRGLAIERD